MFVFNGLKAAVTISGTVATGLAQPSSTQTPVSVGVSVINLHEAQTIYTVTSGKTFYLTAIFVLSGSAVQHILDDTTEKLQFKSYDFTITFPAPIPFTNSVKISADSQISGDSHYAIIGYEV